MIIYGDDYGVCINKGISIFMLKQCKCSRFATPVLQWLVLRTAAAAARDDKLHGVIGYDDAGELLLLLLR